MGGKYICMDIYLNIDINIYNIWKRYINKYIYENIDMGKIYKYMGKINIYIYIYDNI